MKREDCFIAAHDAATGKELWKFQIVPAAGEPGAETWGDADMLSLFVTASTSLYRLRTKTPGVPLF